MTTKTKKVPGLRGAMQRPPIRMRIVLRCSQRYYAKATIYALICRQPNPQHLSRCMWAWVLSVPCHLVTMEDKYVRVGLVCVSYAYKKEKMCLAWFKEKRCLACVLGRNALCTLYYISHRICRYKMQTKRGGVKVCGGILCAVFLSR